MPKSKEKCQEIRNEMKRKIIQSSMLYFARNGFAGTKISDLARQIGIAQGTIYLYFASKEELFQELFQIVNTSKEISDLKLLSVMPLSAKTKIEKLSGKVLDQLLLDENYAARIALGTQMIFEKNNYVSAETTYQTKLYQYTANMITQGQKEGSVVEGSPMKLADYYWGVVYLYALKKLYTSEYEMITPKDLSRILLKEAAK